MLSKILCSIALLSIISVQLPSIAWCQQSQEATDSILIERIYIRTPANYRPGDKLVSVDLLNTYEGIAQQYRYMLNQRKTIGRELDSLYAVNLLLWNQLDSTKRANNNQIEEMQQQVKDMSSRILWMDLQHIRLMNDAELGYKKVKKAQKRQRGGGFLFGRWDKPTRKAVYIGGGLSLGSLIGIILYNEYYIKK